MKLRYKIKMWMITGHQFEITFYAERMSCEEIECFMHKEAIKRGFLGGINDIESFDVELNQ